MAIDHYQILGVDPEADFELIKRQYRILVRENHPDIAADKEAAHEKMQLILTAWSVLSDPTERARYDRARLAAAPPPPKPSQQGPMDSWGSTIPSDAVRKARIAQNFKQARTPHHSANPRTRLLTMVFEAAQLYYEGHMSEAVNICTKVMRSDPTNAEAPALLGDIYAEQGRKDVALLMYERAMRNQPGNLLYRQKWQGLKNGDVPSAAPTSTAPSSSATPAAAVNGNASQTAAPVGTVPPAPSVTPSNGSPESDTAPSSLKSKLTGWMGKRKS